VEGQEGAVSFREWLAARTDREDGVGRCARLLPFIEGDMSTRHDWLHALLAAGGPKGFSEHLTISGDFARAWREWSMRLA